MPADFDFSIGEVEAVGGVIGSQQNSIMSAIVDDYVPDELVNDFKVGKGKALHVWGVVYYEDIFGLPHETEFCQCITGLPNDTIDGWMLPHHSKAT
jgi:hypothetical protein